MGVAPTRRAPLRGAYLRAWVRPTAYLGIPWLGWVLPAPLDVVAVVVLSLASAVALACRPQDDARVLLLVAAFTVCDLSPLSYEGSVVRLYQLAGLQVLVVVLRRWRELWKGLADARGLARGLLYVMAAVTIVTPLSLLWSIAPGQTVVSAVGQVSASGLLFLYCAAVLSRLLSARDVVVAVWAMATVGSTYGLVQFVVSVLTPVDLAESGGSGVPWPRPEGLMTEAVWGALVAATGAVLAFVVRRTYPRVATASLAVHVIMIALVLSRAVILGAAIGAAVLLVTSGRRHLTPGRLTAAAAMLLLTVGVTAVVAPALLQRFDPRQVVGGQGSDGGSAASRGAVFDLVADELPKHLPLGAGAGTLNELTSDPEVRDRYIDGGELNTGRGSTNFFIGYTFDFGPFGTLLAIALVVVTLLIATRLLTVDHGVALYLAVVYIIDFQFNNGFRFGFVHLLLGVAAARYAIDPEGRPDGRAAANAPTE